MVFVLMGSCKLWFDFKGCCCIWLIVGVLIMYCLMFFLILGELIIVYMGIFKSFFMCLIFCGWGLCFVKKGFLLFWFGKLFVFRDEVFLGYVYWFVSGILLLKFFWIVFWMRSGCFLFGVKVGIFFIFWLKILIYEVLVFKVWMFLRYFFCVVLKWLNNKLIYCNYLVCFNWLLYCYRNM